MERQKVLTVSARDYVESQSRILEDYEMVGVKGSGYGGNALEDLCINAPKETEVIVDLRTSWASPVGYPECENLYGTALVPKTKEK